MKIHAIIVDDEPLARERIRLLLRDEPDLEIVCECGNGGEAVAQIKRHKPELLFLDIQMPGMDGFEVLENVPQDDLPTVLFTTAYDKHALRAFDAHALDYLLKPFKPARFKDALERARRDIANKQAGTTARGLFELLAERTLIPSNQVVRLAVKTNDKVLFVGVDDIDSIESAGNYVVLHAGKDNHILRETLTNLEAKLPSKKFMRISRGAIVNLEKVRELQSLFRGENAVILKNGKSIPTTRSVREIQEKLETR